MSRTYAQNKQSILDYQDKIRVLIRDAKSQPCTDCGISYPFYVMHFDHVRGKKLFNISSWMGKSLPKVIAEIAKCEVVCANCHAARTYMRVQGLGAYSKAYNVLSSKE